MISLEQACSKSLRYQVPGHTKDVAWQFGWIFYPVVPERFENSGQGVLDDLFSYRSIAQSARSGQRA